MRDLSLGVLVERMKQRPNYVGVQFLPNHVAAGDIYVAYTAKWARPFIDIPLALRRGASVIVAESGIPVPGTDDRVILCTVPSATRAYAELVFAAEDLPCSQPHLFGITGTKGKTTTARLLWNVLLHAGHSAGEIVTRSATWPGGRLETGCTTPEPRTLLHVLKRMLAANVTHVVLEASSIALAEDRLGALACDVAVWTNTGSDHIAYHGGRGKYVGAKARLFRDHLTSDGVAVINADDPAALGAIKGLSVQRRTFGIASGDIKGTILAMSDGGMALKVNGYPIRTSLVGTHNAVNICAVVAVAEVIGIPPGVIGEGIAALKCVPGRFQRISHGQLDVIIDYAHTPESVDVVLRTVRSLWPRRRVVTLLGAGGGTDRAKRGPMAASAAEHSDLVVLTEDNSRDEPLDRILRDLTDGVAHNHCRVRVPRSAALLEAVEWARPDGVAVILGRGDEKLLISGTRTSFFDDAAFIRGLLRAKPSHVDQEGMCRL